MQSSDEVIGVLVVLIGVITYPADLELQPSILDSSLDLLTPDLTNYFPHSDPLLISTGSSSTYISYSVKDIRHIQVIGEQQFVEGTFHYDGLVKSCIRSSLTPGLSVAHPFSIYTVQRKVLRFQFLRFDRFSAGELYFVSRY